MLIGIEGARRIGRRDTGCKTRRTGYAATQIANAVACGIDKGRLNFGSNRPGDHCTER
ncbi:hypothetical protein [Nitrosococcus oceani]|uniref:hypothetical protein n=1 Tax=Nitrosococcus oceani TaxID=1229 RepID=UPI001E5C53BE|nr:hypothetical protein [Nitrosococcus oceani]